MSSKKITKDNTKKDSGKMLKILKDFKKINKRYNISCYNQLLINTDFYRLEEDFKEIFKELLPFTFSLKPIINYCGEFVENAELLTFDEIENIIKKQEEQDEEKEQEDDDELKYIF